MKYKMKILLMAAILLGVAQFAAADSVLKTMYIDGVQVGQASADAGLSWPAGRIIIGAEGNTGYLYNEYLGKIDDFAVYSGVLSQGQIDAHYAARTNYSSYCSAVAADKPLLWLKFDDSSTANGQTALNSGSVTGRNGAYTIRGTSSTINKITTGFTTGSNAIEIAGSRGTSGDGSCVAVTDAGDFSYDTNGDVSVEVWVNYKEITDYPRIYQHNGSWQSHGAYGLTIPQDSNQFVMEGGGVSNYVSVPVDVNNSTWHHIVITYNSTYVLPDTNSYEEEVSSDNPVVWLRFEDTQPKDYSATGSNHWVGYGSAATIVDKVGGIGKSVYLNGTSESGVYGVAVSNGPNSPPAVNSDYEVVGDQYAFCPNDITFEMWYKTLPTSQSQPSAYAPFFQQIGNNEPCAPAVTNSDGQIRIFGGSASYTGVSPRFNQKWHQLVVSYDQNEVTGLSMRAKLYLDGLLMSQSTFTGAAARLGPEMSHLVIGAANNIGYTYSPFAGYVDEFAIYNGVLSDDRILHHYAAWQPKDCQKVIERGYGSSADINQDCKVNFGDFAALAQNWLKCNKPATTGCTPNW